jgi:hypothetical protein
MKKITFLISFLIISILSIANPSIKFQNSRIFSSGSNSQGLAVGDLNGDNKPDLVVSNVGLGTIKILLDTGSGIEYGTPITLSTLSSTAVVYLGDLNNDSKLDILVCYSNSSNFSIFRNQYTTGIFSSSSFATRQDIAVPSVSSTNTGAIEDINGDGLQDILIASYNSNNLSIFRNITTVATAITFQNVTSTSLGVGAGPAGVNCFDFDGDGKKDIAVNNYSGNSVSVYKNNSTTSTFSISLAQNIYVPGNPLNSCVADIDLDGKFDIITSNYSGLNISIFRNTSTGSTISFASGFFLSVGTSNLQGVIATDLNYDGKPELIVNSIQNSSVIIFENKAVPGVINSSSFLPAYSRSTGTTPIEVRSGDFDGDGKTDIAMSNYTSGNVHVYKNQSIQGGAYIQSDSLIATKEGNRIKLQVKKGSGAKRMFIAKLDSAVNILPTDTIIYSSDSNFGSGFQLGNGNFIISIDTGNTAYMYNIILGKTYHFACLEFVGTGNLTNYNTINPTRTSLYNINYYYSKSSGVLNNLSSWGSLPDGSGPSPSSFNDSFAYFTVRNNPTPTINGNLSISGNYTGLIFGDALTSFNLLIPANFTIYADSMSFRRQFVTTIQGNLFYNKAVFDTLTTMQYVSSSQQTIPGGSMFNLVVTGGQKNLSNNLNVRNSLSLIGILNTSIYTLSIGTSINQIGTLNRTNGFIVGKLLRWFNTTNTSVNGLFPLGTNSYRPLNIEFTTQPSSGGTLLSSFESVNPGNSGLPLFDFSSGFATLNKTAPNGYWKLTPGNGLNGGTHNLTITADGFWGITNVPDIRIVKRNPNGIWTLEGTAGTNFGSSATPILSRTGLISYGEYAIAGDSVTDPLPMTWLQSSLSLNENQVIINWKTSNEINVSHYEIEESNDGKEFFSIGIAKAFNNLIINNYFFNLPEINFEKYYRIRSIDFDGSYSFSKLMKLNESTENQIKIYPNPAKSIITIQTQEIINRYSIISSDGKLITNSNVLNQIDVSTIETGLYYLILELQNGQTINTKFNKL